MPDDEWIATSTGKRPDKESRVMVNDTFSGVMEGRYGGGMAGTGWYHDNGCLFLNVTHWRPKPAAPSEH